MSAGSHMKSAAAFFDASVMLERLIWIAAVIDIDSSELAKFWEDWTEDDVLPPELQLPPELLRNGVPNDDFFEHLGDKGIQGFLARATTPIMRPSGAALTGNWNARWTQWIYADTLEDLQTKAIAWAHAQQEKDRARFVEEAPT